jgi:hypothetical protein
MSTFIGEVHRRGPRSFRRVLLWLYTCSIAGVFVLGMVLVIRDARPALPVNASLTKAAWDAFNKANYAHAIDVAQKVIADFGKEADRIQQQLENTAGNPDDLSDVPARRQAILTRGPLNDVATCYLVEGWSAKYLNNKELARSAFSHAKLYTYARTLNADGTGFWSPAEAADTALADMR